MQYPMGEPADIPAASSRCLNWTINIAAYDNDPFYRALKEKLIAGRYSGMAITRRKSITDHVCDVIVSPANSFGFMDGGLDLHLRSYYESNDFDIERRAKLTADLYPGHEIPVGAACRIDNPVLPLILAPTMRVPMILPKDSVNVYLATKAALACVHDGETVVFPSMGTGVGQMSAELAARQMLQAILDMKSWSPPPNHLKASKRHQSLYTDGPFRDLQFEGFVERK